MTVHTCREGSICRATPGACAGPRHLARFRADPSKVRVTMRPHGREWVCSIESDNGLVIKRGTSPKKALVRALREADRADLEGIDLGMEWAYPHPWGADR